MLLLITILDQENRKSYWLINTEHIVLICPATDEYWRKFSINNPDYPAAKVPTDAKSFIEISGDRGYFVTESLADIVAYIIERRKFENAYIQGTLND